jgi:prophage regulatory protein
MPTRTSSEIDPIIRLKDFLRLTGLGRSTVYKLMADGVLARPLKIGVRAVGFRTSYVNTFLQGRPSSGVKHHE